MPEGECDRENGKDAVSNGTRPVYWHSFTHNSSIPSIHGPTGLQGHGKGSDFLQTFPDRLGTGMTVVLAPQEAPKPGDQAYHLAQWWWDSGWLGLVGDDPGRPPFLRIEHHGKGRIRAVPAPRDQMQDAPGIIR